jgi:hypothetical protein
VLSTQKINGIQFIKSPKYEHSLSTARFWEQLRVMVSSKYKFKPVQFVDKLESVCLAAAGIEGLHIFRMNDNRITRVELEKINPVIQDFKRNSGFFYEYRLRDILELVPLCNAKMQTIAFLGNREVLMPLLKCGVKGIDRVADIEHTMDFDLIWDWYDLMEPSPGQHPCHCPSTLPIQQTSLGDVQAF